MRELTEDEQLTFDILSAPPTTNKYLKHRQRNDKVWWTQANGMVKMTKMEDSHIRHAIVMLEINKQEYTRAYRGLKAELKRRNIG